MEMLSEIQQEALASLRESPDEEKLWNCVLAFQEVPFRTASGLPFSYTVKRGRNGSYNRELMIDRRERSKSLTWGSIRYAFERALEMKGTVLNRPKALGDIRGISYIFPLLWRFGLIEVSEKSRCHMSGEEKNDQLSFLE